MRTEAAGLGHDTQLVVGARLEFSKRDLRVRKEVEEWQRRLQFEGKLRSSAQNKEEAERR